MTFFSDFNCSRGKLNDSRSVTYAYQVFISVILPSTRQYCNIILVLRTHRPCRANRRLYYIIIINNTMFCTYIMFVSRRFAAFSRLPLMPRGARCATRHGGDPSDKEFGRGLGAFERRQRHQKTRPRMVEAGPVDRNPGARQGRS